MAKKSLKIHHNAFLHISSAKMFIEPFNHFFTPIIFKFSYIHAEIAIFSFFKNYEIILLFLHKKARYPQNIISLLS